MTTFKLLPKYRKPSWAKALYDGALPLDVVFSGSNIASQRPGILSRFGDEEDGLDDNNELDEE